MRKRKIAPLDEDLLQYYGFTNKKEYYQFVMHGSIIIRRKYGHKVYDEELQEPYLLYHVQHANDSFVSGIREEVETCIQNIIACCGEAYTQRKHILNYVFDTYQTIGYIHGSHLYSIAH